MDRAQLAELLAARWMRRGRVAVAFSGGADSTALLAAAVLAGLKPEAWHIDHGWHPRSGAWAAHARRVAEDLGVRCVVVRVSQGRGNLEAEARRARFRAFEELARRRGISTVWLAHHADDQAETIALRLLMGAGPEGLRGMQERRQARGLVLERPLLRWRRSAIRARVREAGIPWIEDPANLDLRFRRVWVRRRLFPQIEALGVDPVRLFLRLGAQAARVHEALMGELARVPIRAREGKAFVDLEAWRAAPSPLRALILKALMRCVLGPGVAPGRRHIMLAERWTAQGARGGVDITRGRLMREGQTIAFGTRGFMESSSTPRYRSS